MRVFNLVTRGPRKLALVQTGRKRAYRVYPSSAAAKTGVIWLMWTGEPSIVYVHNRLGEVVRKLESEWSKRGEDDVPAA
jgi:hypothetical protein